jgi:SHS family sialic acid transporter-like MFS transporter
VESSQSSPANDRGKWMALFAALLGWMFDGFEIGLFPLVGPAAIEELLGTQSAVDPALKREWFGVIMAVFLVGAATGGVLFGWLADRIGRVRAMSVSILTYAIFTGLCGFAAAAWHIAVLRFIASLGMGGEWAIGVALVTEIWPDRSRAFIAGLIGAAANVGMLLVGFLSLSLLNLTARMRELMESAGVSAEIQSYLLSGDGWRLLMIAGAVPAFLVFFIRLFVPESEKWEKQRDSGSTSYWATRDLIGVLIGTAGATAVIVVWSPLFDKLVQQAWPAIDSVGAAGIGPAAVRVACTAGGLLLALLGFIHPVLCYLRRAEAAGQFTSDLRQKYLGRMLFGAAIAGIPLLGTWGSLQWAPKWATALAAQSDQDHANQFAKEYTQIAIASGAIFGTIIAAWAAGRFGRRITYAMLCVASFASLVFLYQANTTFDSQLLVSVFLAGASTATFYGWFPLYLPELFPTSIRATCQGFAYNFGRVLSAVGSLQTAALTAYFAHGIATDRTEIEAFPHAGATLAGIYILGVVVIWLGPETKGQPLLA